MVRRKPGALLPLELELLDAAIEMQRAGDESCYGYALAKAMMIDGQHSRMIAHGTLYKALGRLTSSGLLDSWWEDPAVAQLEGRPSRRLYRITAEGSTAWSAARSAAAEPTSRRRAVPGAAITNPATS